MNTSRFSSVLILCSLLGSLQVQVPCLAESGEIKAPIDTSGTTPVQQPQAKDSIGGLSAPGADEIMNSDFLMMQNEPGAKPPQPLSTFLGTDLTLDINREDISFAHLHGLMITIVNKTNRPLVIDGDKATALVSGANVRCVSVTVIQNAIIPARDLEHLLAFIGTHIAPAAISIGVIPTTRDIITDRKPVLDRYGYDEKRRRVEASRFGRRILWPNEKTQGIVFFQMQEPLTGARIEVPASTLFDAKDACMMVSQPGTTPSPAAATSSQAEPNAELRPEIHPVQNQSTK
jgi:hypothetical protein